MRKVAIALLVVAAAIAVTGCNTIDRGITLGKGLVTAVADTYDILHGPVADVASLWSEFGDVFGAAPEEKAAPAADPKSAPTPEAEPLGDPAGDPVGAGAPLLRPSPLSPPVVAGGDLERSE